MIKREFQIGLSEGMCGLLVLSAVALGADRPMAERVDRDKEATAVQRIAVITKTEKPLNCDYRVGGGRHVLGLRDGDVTWNFDVVSGATTEINPEGFVRMWGTQEGAAQMANVLGQMLAGARIEAPLLDVVAGQPIPGRIDGVLLFEHTDDRVALLFSGDNGDGEEPELQIIIALPIGCKADVPGSTCGCTADGRLAKCQTGINGDGSAWAVCGDNTGTMACNGKGHDCVCAAR